MRYGRFGSAVSLVVLFAGFVSAELHGLEDHSSEAVTCTRVCDACRRHEAEHYASAEFAEHHSCNACFFQRLLSSPLPLKTAVEPARDSGFQIQIDALQTGRTFRSFPINRGPPAS
jgi:hypothetical protein